MATPTRTLNDIDALLSQIAVELQLPATLDEEAREHYQALTKYLSQTSLARYSPDLYPQGSFRIGTTVKPLAREEFDLDFVVELQVPPHVTPSTVYDRVAGEIEANPRYAGTTERKSRCIRISYRHLFHMDIVPAIPNPSGGPSSILIPSKESTGTHWQPTNPKGYAEWFDAISQARYAEKRAGVEPLPPPAPAEGKSPVQIATQLLKRNHHLLVKDEDLRTPSIVLTTVTASSSHAGAFSVQACMDATVAAVQALAARPSPPRITHPVQPEEVISEKWNSPQVWHGFRAHARTLAKQWGAVIESLGTGYENTSRLLTAMFGEAPVREALKSLADRTRRLSERRQIVTVTGGALAASLPNRGNPAKTFYGQGR